MRDDDIARAGNSALDGGVAVTERNRHFWKRGGPIAERATTIDLAQGTPRSITMPLLTAQGRMNRVAHEHRHDHASHEGSKSARGGGATEHADHGDTHPSSDVIYTCPMHPQIRQIGPGNCPICGMTLEPLIASTEAEPNAELVDMTRRFWIGLALTAPVLVLEMGGHLFNLHHLLAPQMSNWLQLILATPVVLWAGWPFFVRGAQSLVTRNLNMFTLIAMGTGVAWIYSVVATLAPSALSACISQRRRLCPDLFRGGGGHYGPGSAWTSS